MPIIDLNDAYILNETGAEVDKTTGIPFKDEALTDAEAAQARANIRAGASNRNLLDNWYFVGGGSQLGDGVFPINQRGQASYTSDGASVDRWKQYASTVTLSSAGLTVAPSAYSNNFLQVLSPAKWQALEGETVTLSFNVVAITGSFTIAGYNTALGTISETGITSITFTIPSGIADGNKFFGLAGQSGSLITLESMKVERGTYSTLANDVPPDFGEELRKCQRYLRDIPLTRYPIVISGSNAVLTLIGIEMRGVPNVALISSGGVAAAGGSQASITNATVTEFTHKTPTVNFALSGSIAYVAGYIYDTVIRLSAEL